MRIVLKTIFIFIISFHGFGQASLEEGFQLLETGNFKQAEVFFENQLHTNPDHKTVLICYGRSVGLNGRPKFANRHFANMVAQTPNDYEITINYAESFLWAKQYDQALPIYKNLVHQYPNRFGAILGYANTLSNLKNYDEAFKWIRRALELDPTNQSARISEKYIRLGQISTYMNQQKYGEGKRVLDFIFSTFPEDKDALLTLANIHLITKNTDSAKVTYRRYTTSTRDTVVAQNGMALAEHIAGNEKEALRITTENVTRIKGLDDSERSLQTYERHIQALLWNRKFSRARRLIDSLYVITPKENRILALRATLSLYTGAPKKSTSNYNTILAQDSLSFDGNLGKANALLATGGLREAYEATQKTLQLFPNQKDALELKEKIRTMHIPNLQEQAGYTFDNGNNVAHFSTTAIELPLSFRLKTTATYGFRTTENTATSAQANAHTFTTGLYYNIWSKTLFAATIGINKARFEDSTYVQPIFRAKLQMQPFPLHNMTLTYQRELQNFNADLIAQKIVQHHYGLTYNLSSNFGLGWYTQLMHTEQSDANTRKLLFTSLYYTLFRKPALKLGLNYQWIAFRDQVPTIYFSPEAYQAAEVFVDFQTKLSSKTKFAVNAALGQQQVETDPLSSIFRAESHIQHQFSRCLNFSIYGKYSNIASATATGFEFTELGIKMHWLFMKKPMFHKF